MPPEEYRVDPPAIPADDRSGPIGQRILRLLSIQVERNIACLAQERRKAGITDEDKVIMADPQYAGHFLGGNAYAMAVLCRFGVVGETMAGRSREELERTAVAVVRAMADTYESAESDKVWRPFSSGRFVHLLGMGAWLLWDKLDAETQVAVARILAAESDRFLDRPAPAQLYDDTQAESNAWTGGGLAVAACMLKLHPRREQWLDKAKEYMISAYATERDVASDRVVDGKPLREWLTGPNALPDYAVENHGFVHADYIAAVSEMVRSVIAFRFAGEAAPEAPTFNADHVFDMLMRLSLPDGTHFYLQSTDYTARRVDSLWQACNIVPLRPTPLRIACFERSLSAMETMADQWPEIPMSGWLGCPYELGSTWGLTQNYLMCRLFGIGGEAVADEQIKTRLAGVHVSREGKFVIHRTPKTISRFSWHPAGECPKVMGMTMSLDRDLLCYPMPWNYIGEVRERSGGGAMAAEPSLKVKEHRVCDRGEGFGAMAELEWCSGKILQSCAFVSLPDGRTVYFEERRAADGVTVASATSGNVAFFDDLRWPHQSKARTFYGEGGPLALDASSSHTGNWVNVDDRMGYVVLGCYRFRLSLQKGRACIRRGSDTMYDTCRLSFTAELPDRAFEPGERLCAFAMASCPNQTAKQTKALAARVQQDGWVLSAARAFALKADPYMIYANFGAEPKRAYCDGEAFELPASSCGWLVRPDR